MTKEEYNRIRKLASRKMLQSRQAGNKDVTKDGVFNPRAFGGKKTNSKGKVVATSSDSRMFNSKGELNAYDQKDAFKQIAHLVQTVLSDPKNKGVGRIQASLDRFDAGKSEMLRQAMNTSEGRKVVGAEIMAVIKEAIDYEGWARRMLRQKKLSQGEIFRIQKDIVNQVGAWITGQDGQAIAAQVQGKYIFGNTWNVDAFVEIAVEDVYLMLFDGLDRGVDLAKQDIERKEDQAFISLIDAASTTINDLTAITTLDLASLEALRYQVDKNRLPADKFLINRAEVSDLVTELTTAANSDPMTSREMLLSGYIGNILNCSVITSTGLNAFEVVPAGTAYCIARPEYLGVFGERIPLFSQEYNELPNKSFKQGWGLLENIGMILPNAGAVSKGTK